MFTELVSSDIDFDRRPDFLPELDFDQQFASCISSMCQDDAFGQTLVFERAKGKLQMRHIAALDLVDTDIDRYEMVVFDGGTLSGDTWKHVFFPRQRTHCFVYDA